MSVAVTIYREVVHHIDVDDVAPLLKYTVGFCPKPAVANILANIVRNKYKYGLISNSY